MELRESIESINELLLNHYGRDISDGRANFRVIFSDGQFEKRITHFDDKGNQLLMPEVRLLPKYSQWCPHRYILERLTPIVGETDLLEKLAYESVWVFQDKHKNYLPPFFEGCKLLIDNILTNMGTQSHFAKYKESGQTKEEYLAHIQKVEDDLFGNETQVGDALAYGSGVVVPGNIDQN